jgi:hypothetical protein
LTLWSMVVYLKAAWPELSKYQITTLKLTRKKLNQRVNPD